MKRRDSNMGMTIHKTVEENFLITSEELLKLLRVGKCQICLKGDIDQTLEVNDYQYEVEDEE